MLLPQVFKAQGLCVLGEQGGIETGRLTREAYLLGPSLAGVLTRMAIAGLIERQRCPQDARRTAAIDGIARPEAFDL